MLTLTPVLQAKDGSMNKVLPQVVVYGRRRAIVNEREGNVPKDAFEIIRRQKGVAQTINYTARVPFEAWMNGATLDLMADLCGCANHLQEEETATLMPVNLLRYSIVPHIAFVAPKVEEVKARAEEGKAYLDFPVNKTTIYPDYRRNPEELKKIIATIDLVKNDPNTRITEIDIVGYIITKNSDKGMVARPSVVCFALEHCDIRHFCTSHAKHIIYLFCIRCNYKQLLARTDSLCKLHKTRFHLGKHIVPIGVFVWPCKLHHLLPMPFGRHI
jgi:hypothetical protein